MDEAVTTDGIPEIEQLLLEIDSPAGKDGELVHPVMIPPDTDGVMVVIDVPFVKV